MLEPDLEALALAQANLSPSIATRPSLTSNCCLITKPAACIDCERESTSMRGAKEVAGKMRQSGGASVEARRRRWEKGTGVGAVMDVVRN